MRTVRNKVQSGIDVNIMYILNILISTDIETERSRVAKTNETLSLPSCVCVFVLLSLSVVFRCVGGYASNTHTQSLSLSLFPRPIIK